MIHLNNKFTLVTSTLMLAASLFACSSPGEKVSAPPATEERKELSVSLGGEPSDGFDPTLRWGVHDTLIFQSSLLVYDTDMNLKPDLATGYEVSNDGLTYTFALRNDVKFSDGEAFTAEDVVFTFEKAAKTCTFIDYSNLESIRAQGDHTVVFTIKEAQSIFPHLVLRQGIVPAHCYDEDTYSAKPVGTGPFVLIQWDRGQQIIAERNPHYYGQMPYFEKITFVFLGEDASLAAAKAGTVDVIMTTPVLATSEIPGMNLISLDALDARGICFPMVPKGHTTREDGKLVGNNVTTDTAIRKAVNIALDRKTMVTGVLNGHGSEAFTECDYAPWHNPEAKFTDNDLAGAIKILEDGGWVDTDGDGIREKNGVKAEFKIIYNTTDSVRQSLAMVAADMLTPLGLDVAAEGHSWDELFTMLYESPWVFGTGEMNPMVSYKEYSTKYMGVSTNNTMYYQNPVTDDYFARALRATDQENANELWRLAQWDGTTGTSVKGEAPVAWLVNLNHLYYINENLDIGNQRLHGHGTTWQLARNIEEWRWKGSEPAAGTLQ